MHIYFLKHWISGQRYKTDGTCMAYKLGKNLAVLFFISVKRVPLHLLNLLQEEGGALEVHLEAVLLHSLIENHVVRLRQFDAWEQVGGDAIEERQVVAQEFGQVDINDGAQHEDVLIFLRVLQLLMTATCECTQWDCNCRSTVVNDIKLMPFFSDTKVMSKRWNCTMIALVRT